MPEMFFQVIFSMPCKSIPMRVSTPGSGTLGFTIDIMLYDTLEIASRHKFDELVHSEYG
jgi:hypothetical protein